MDIMRFGMTVPFDTVPLGEQKPLYELLEASGYTDLWSAETNSVDAFTPLTLGSQWAPTMRLGTAIVPVYTRGPGVLAASVAAQAELAPGRFVIGIGSSSNVIVQGWNSIPFEEPYAKVKDMLEFLKSSLAGEKVGQQYKTFKVDGFKLAKAPEIAPKIMVAGLREGMLRLAGRESDGAIINWLGAAQVSQVAEIVHNAAPSGSEREIVARVFCCPSTDADKVRAGARRAIAAYLNVPVYKAFHQWLGNEERLGAMWAKWDEGDRKGALEAIGDEIVDELVVHGSPEECRAKLQAYYDGGVTTVAVALLPLAEFDLKAVLPVIVPDGCRPKG